jgi:hypothetical protein
VPFSFLLKIIIVCVYGFSVRFSMTGVKKTPSKSFKLFSCQKHFTEKKVKQNPRGFGHFHARGAKNTALIFF